MIARRQTGRAAGGYGCTLKRGIVDRKAAQQPSVTTNSFESEALQLSTTGNDVVKLRHYQEHDCGLPDSEPSTVYVGNEAVQTYSQNVALTRAARHTVQAVHYGRQR